MVIAFTYDIDQTETKVVITIVIPPSVNPKALDVTVTDLCVTVTAAPHYVLNIDLSNPVRVEGIRCKFKQGILHIDAFKERADEWESIVYQAGVEDADQRSAEIAKRRDESFKRFQQHEMEKKRLAAETAAVERRRQIEADAEQRQQRTQAEREHHERQVREAKGAISFDEGSADVVSVVSKPMPAVRTIDTVMLVDDFTKRRIAAPAREGRDIYVDKKLGPLKPADPNATVDQLDGANGSTKRPLDPFELMDRARDLVSKNKYSDYPSAIEAARQACELAPLSMDAIRLHASLLLHECRSEDVIDVTDKALLIFSGRHYLQRNNMEHNEYSAEIRSTIHALRGAALCQLKKYREGLRVTETALNLTPGNNGLARDAELLRRLVGISED